MTIANQKKRWGPKHYTEDGTRYKITATVRHDDDCHNGHNSFSITGEIYRLKIHHNQMTTICADGSLSLFDINTWKKLSEYNGLNNNPGSLAVDSTTGQIAAGNFSGQIFIWKENYPKPAFHFSIIP